MSVPANDTPLPAVTALAMRSSRPRTSVCSTITTASAPRGTMPPVAMRHRLAGMNHRGRDDAGVNLFVAQQHRARHFFGRAEGVLRHDGEAIDVRAIERRHVDGRHDVSRQHPAERRVERDDFNAARRAVNRGPETPLRFIAIEDLEKLLLLTHSSQTFTSAPGAKPSLSSPTITKPSARVVDDSSDAPAMASGSTSPSTIFTRA